jgi:hypothetical protein
VKEWVDGGRKGLHQTKMLLTFVDLRGQGSIGDVPDF